MTSVLIIAEAGVNHNGSLELAKQLINSAAIAGADFVKFQTFITELNISRNARKADYQIKNQEKPEETQYEMVKKLELNFEDFRQLKEHCESKEIGFLSTGFDFPSIDFLDELNIPFFKIPSGEITNKPYLQHIARKKKPVIMSTGMAYMEEIKAALKVLMNQGLKRDQITVLHCNTEYPTPMNDVNLKAMLTIKKELGVKVGYSDHTLGIEVPIAAVALGATIIEKHFTLDRNLPGPDHKASLEPNELKAMVNAIRNIELAISGNGEKKPTNSEIRNQNIARKSLFLSVDVLENTILEYKHLIPLRPGNGISPMDIDKVVGKRIKHSRPASYQLSLNDLY